MFRRFRCPTPRAAALAALLAVFSFAFPPHAARAQNDSPKDRLAVKLRLGDGVRMWRPTRRQIGVAYASGSNKSPGGAFQFSVDRKKLRGYLTKTARYIKRDPKDSRIVTADVSNDEMGPGQTPAKIIPGYDGAALDVDAAVDTVEKAIESDPATVHIVLPIKVKPARLSAEKVKGINARIAHFVTHFNPGEVGRTRTVRRAIDLIDGTLVSPGETFSVNETVGERTAQRGFGKGHVFVDGKMEVQLGGGMCQVATTLFNAAMLADLDIVERHQHVRTIPYADPGRDATVYWGQKDFKFKNDTGAPVYVSYKTTRTHAIVSLYGKATPGKRVRLVNHYRRLGERRYTGSFYRVVFESDGTKHKDPTFYSSYKWTPALDYSH